jgi:hypothetical protein
MTDVAETAETGTVQQPRPYERFVASLQKKAEAERERGHFDLTANQMDAALTAETEQEIWDADEGGLVALKDLIGAELEITDYRELPSTDPTMDNGLGVFIIGTATLMNDVCGTVGEVIQFNTGVPTVIAKLAAFKSHGIWPLRTLVSGVKAGKGEMVRLRQIPKRITAGKAEQA